MNKFFIAFRSTPHSTTGKSPAELLFRRVMKTKMLELTYMEEEVKGGAKRSGTEMPKGNRQTRIMLTRNFVQRNVTSERAMSFY